MAVVNEIIKERIEKIIKTIRKSKYNAIVVGPSGRNKKHFRVYLNGGFVLQIPVMTTGHFHVLEKEFVSDKKDYVKEQDREKLKKIRNDIEEINKNKGTFPFYKVYEYFEESNNYYLNEYLKLANTATKGKFTQEHGGKKERNWQTEIIKNKIKAKSTDGFIVFDMEFQTRAIENPLRDDGVSNRGKPDYVGFDGEKFYLVELKTNISACEGECGLKEHENDMKALIKHNLSNSNSNLVEEFIHRFTLLLEYGIIDKSWKPAIEKIIERGSKDCLDYCFLFLINGNYSKEDYISQVDVQNITTDKVFFCKDNFEIVRYKE